MDFPEWVVNRSASRTAFVQGDYVGEVDRGGFCASLSFAWTRQILDATKGRWGVPQQLVTARLQTLGKAAPGLILKQRQYSLTQKELMQELQESIQPALDLEDQQVDLVEDVRILKEGKRKLEDFKKKQIVQVGDVAIPRTLLALAAVNTVRISEVLKVGRFDDVAAAQTFAKDHLVPEWTHVLGIERFHAIAVYRTNGVFSTDYYFFDPNCGEFLCNGYTDAGFALYALLHTVSDYQKYKELYSFHTVAE